MVGIIVEEPREDLEIFEKIFISSESVYRYNDKYIHIDYILPAALCFCCHDEHFLL